MWWNEEKGFSLVEALVATALMGVGFAGTFTLMSVTRGTSDEALARQKMQLVANQIFEVMETDLSNIDSYVMDLKTCVTPDVGETDVFDLKQFEWCSRLTAEIGTPFVAETRSINITTLGDGRKVAHIELEGKNQQVQVVMKRTYDN